MRSKTKRLTLSGALVALTVVMLWLGSLVEVLDLVTVFTASLFIAFSVCEFGVAWSVLPYFASAVLALLLMPGRFISWEYALLVGALPLLKALFEKIPAKPLAFLGKFAAFNALFAGVLCIFHFFFGGLFVETTLFGVTFPVWSVPLILVLFGNLCFLLYDILLTRMVVLYYARFHQRVERWLK